MAHRLGSGSSNAQAGEARRTVRNAVERAATLQRTMPGQHVVIPQLTVRVPRDAGEREIVAALTRAIGRESKRWR
jgi:hypothetical protein